MLANVTILLQVNNKPHRNLLFTAAIACFGVYEEVSDVCLVFFVIPGQAGDDGRVWIGNDGSVEVPGVFVIRNQYQDSVGAFCRHREEGTHQSGADASGWMGEVEFQDGVEIPGQAGNDGRCQSGDDEVEGEQEIFFDLDCGV